MWLESAENLDFSIRKERQKQTASTLHRTFAQFANDFIFFQCAQLLHFYLPVLSYWLPIYFMWNEIRAKASKTRLLLVFWNYSYILRFFVDTIWWAFTYRFQADRKVCAPSLRKEADAQFALTLAWKSPLAWFKKTNLKLAGCWRSSLLRTVSNETLSVSASHWMLLLCFCLAWE